MLPTLGLSTLYNMFTNAGQTWPVLQTPHRFRCVFGKDGQPWAQFSQARHESPDCLRPIRGIHLEYADRAWNGIVSGFPVLSRKSQYSAPGAPTRLRETETGCMRKGGVSLVPQRPRQRIPENNWARAESGNWRCASPKLPHCCCPMQSSAERAVVEPRGRPVRNASGVSIIRSSWGQCADHLCAGQLPCKLTHARRLSATRLACGQWRLARSLPK